MVGGEYIASVVGNGVEPYGLYLQIEVIIDLAGEIRSFCGIGDCEDVVEFTLAYEPFERGEEKARYKLPFVAETPAHYFAEINL